MPENHLLAIPVFNEERHLSGVLAEARRFSRNILVVDDGSTDRTADLIRAEDGIQVITHATNLGYGTSVADAFGFARRHGYKWLITMDCDEQHEPGHIPEFVAVARRAEADVISGTRYPTGHDVNSEAPPERREINRRITELLNLRLGLGITDAFCGFKAYRVAALAHFNITVAGYAMPIQLWVQLARAGLRVEEVPVRLIYHDLTRQFGGVLDNPTVRLAHYLDVFEEELAAGEAVSSGRFSDCVQCR